MLGAVDRCTVLSAARNSPDYTGRREASSLHLLGTTPGVGNTAEEWVTQFDLI